MESIICIEFVDQMCLSYAEISAINGDRPKGHFHDRGEKTKNYKYN